jgi:hypothetical protein
MAMRISNDRSYKNCKWEIFMQDSGESMGIPQSLNVANGKGTE